MHFGMDKVDIEGNKGIKINLLAVVVVIDITLTQQNRLHLLPD
jgi:hypothetical protein